MTDNSLIKLSYKLAKAGLNNKQIIEALHISKSSFYANMDIMDTIQKARQELREEVSNTLLEKASTGDTSSLLFLAKRLNLFSEEINISLKNPTDALSSFEKISNANISIEHKNALRHLIEGYFKAYEITELEQRISALENSEN